MKKMTLTLTLPFVDFKGTQKNSFERNSYNELGTYFIRNRMGSHEIVVVSGDTDNDVWCNPIPEAVTEQFFVQSIEEQQADKFDAINKRMDEMRELIIKAMDIQTATIRSDINEVCDTVRYIKEDTEQLLNSAEVCEPKPKEVFRSARGYVNEDVLLQIIKEMKK